MEKEMENVFETKVKEKKQKLKDSEHELTQKHKNVSFTTCHYGHFQDLLVLFFYHGDG